MLLRKGTEICKCSEDQVLPDFICEIAFLVPGTVEHPPRTCSSLPAEIFAHRFFLPC
jgi:hypothetical protein